MISTRDLSRLPDIDELRALLQSIAMLDAILSRDWQYRYYSFNSKWAKGEQMGSMRDGCGNEFFALFNKAGCFLKGFHHEARMSPYRERPPKVWPGVLEQVPREFAACLKEPAFNVADTTTFCIWRTRKDTAWQRGDIQFPEGQDPDGSGELLSPLDKKPATYQRWAQGYYEVNVPRAAVKHIYDHQVLSEEIVASLNLEVTLAELKADVKEIGYP